jgi:hypothetical protein
MKAEMGLTRTQATGVVSSLRRLMMDMGRMTLAIADLAKVIEATTANQSTGVGGSDGGSSDSDATAGHDE